MRQNKLLKYLISFIALPLIFWSSTFLLYLFGIHNWAFFLVPFFLILLNEKEHPPTISLGVILVLQDVTSGYWLGTHLFLYGGLALFITSQKRFILSHGFSVIWIIFSLSMLVVLAMREFLGMIAELPPRSLVTLFYEAGFLSCLFPLFSHFLSRHLDLKKGAHHDS